jgi:hypothetical protein
MSDQKTDWKAQLDETQKLGKAIDELSSQNTSNQCAIIASLGKELNMTNHFYMAREAILMERIQQLEKELENRDNPLLE